MLQMGQFCGPIYIIAQIFPKMHGLTDKNFQNFHGVIPPDPHCGRGDPTRTHLQHGRLFIVPQY